MDRKRFMEQPMDIRRRILAEQANDPEIIAYYLEAVEQLENHTHQVLESQVQSSKPIYHNVEVKLEPESTLLGKFQKERTDAISEMFDNVGEHGIYPTTKFFARLDNCVRELLIESDKAARKDYK